MKTMLLAAAAAAFALSSGLAMAQTVPGPKQPIPYSQLKSYMKASPKQRASKDWWSGQSSSASADTGTSANTSATAAAPTPSLPSDTGGPATSAKPPSLGGDTTGAAAPSTPSAGAVNPPATSTPGAPDSTTPPK